MSDEVVANPVASGLSEEQVSEYLTQNPTFFLQHENVLADMFLPHASGEAVSLLERQVSLLRERNIETRKRLSEMLEQGQRNDVLFQKTRALILALLETRSMNDLAGELKRYCIDEFQVDAAELTLVANDQTHKVNQCQVLAEKEIEMAMPMLLKSKEAISGVFRTEELELLFAKSINGIESASAMPIIFENKLVAVLSLGSQDAAYFSNGMDTLFLSFIADVLARLLPKYS